MIRKGNPRQIVLFSLIVAVMAGSLGSTSGCGQQCLRREIVEIGKVESKEAGLKASIPKMAAMVERCRSAEVIRVIWKGPGDYAKGEYPHSLLYDRENKRIGYEDDVESGISGDFYYADDNSISSVAEKQGELTDFLLVKRRTKITQ